MSIVPWADFAHAAPSVEATRLAGQTSRSVLLLDAKVARGWLAWEASRTMQGERQTKIANCRNDSCLMVRSFQGGLSKTSSFAAGTAAASAVETVAAVASG